MTEYADPGQPYRSPRAGFRREVLRQLRTLKADAQRRVNQWNISPDDFYDPSAVYQHGRFGRSNFRYRRPEEYPENSAEQCRAEAAALDRLATDAINLARKMRGHASGIDASLGQLRGEPAEDRAGLS